MALLRKDFGSRLRSIREDRQMSQEGFAEFIGISVDFLSLIERGINAPSFETIEKVAARLEVPVAFLFAFEESEGH
ncbi:MAG: helix-turn-helix transcriptional regulator [Acidobacteriota bacterium]|nr:helix-turn-helix transcriptional regulator [Acidobacteriota bacterium]